MEYQLRIYDVKPGAMEPFLEIFPKVVELRKAAGFTVVGAWTEPGANRFVWIAGYDGPDGFAAAAERYYDSPARAALSPPPSEYIAAVETHMLTAVPGFAPAVADAG